MGRSAVIAPSQRGAAAAAIEEQIRAQAYGLGFHLVGITSLGEVETADAFDRWLARGYAGDMEYLPRWTDKRRDTRLPYPGVTSAIVVAMEYGGREPSGPVARYARGDDYHDVMVERLRELQRWIAGQLGHEVHGKAYVDTGPILERDLARKAGLGWFGKNTMLLNPRLGSFFFLGSLFVDLELEPDPPFATEHCGTCTRCIDACPTQAIVSAGELDATRCISYLTIEAKGEIPVEMRAAVGGLVYGCDICQEVCPFSRKFSRELQEDSAFGIRAALSGRDAGALARELLAMSAREFSEAFRGSPMKRAKLRGLQRNSAVVLGNVGASEDVPLLARALSSGESLVRAHAAWALGRVGGPAAVAALRAREAVESDETVLDEIRSALLTLAG
jgi:epoxyqueuosine reductase